MINATCDGGATPHHLSAAAAHLAVRDDTTAAEAPSIPASACRGRRKEPVRVKTLHHVRAAQFDERPRALPTGGCSEPEARIGGSSPSARTWATDGSRVFRAFRVFETL